MKEFVTESIAAARALLPKTKASAHVLDRYRKRLRTEWRGLSVEDRQAFALTAYARLCSSRCPVSPVKSEPGALRQDREASDQTNIEDEYPLIDFRNGSVETMPGSTESGESNACQEGLEEA